MKKLILFASLFIFCSSVYSSQKIQDISFLGEIAVYPDRILKAIDFNDLYKIQQFSLSAPLFQNNFIRQKNNGFFGINFSDPLNIKFISINGNLVPDLIIEFTIDKMDKIKMVISTFSQGNYTLVQRDKIYWLASSSGKGPAFPMLLKNNRAYILGDASNLNILSPEGTTGKIDLKTISDTSDARAERAFQILNSISDVRKSKKFTTSNILPPEIPVSKQDVLGYFFTDISGDYLDKFYKQFKLEFIKQLIEENTVGRQALIFQKTPLNLEVNNYIFSSDKGSELKKISLNSKLASKIPDNAFMFYMGNGDNAQLRKLLNNKRIFPDNSEFSNIKENITNLISAFTGEIYFYVTPNKKSGAFSVADFFQKFNIALALEISDVNSFENSVNAISKAHPGKIIYQKGPDDLQQLVLTADTYSAVLYIGYADMDKKFAVISSNKNEVQRFQPSSAPLQNNIFSYLKGKKFLTASADNSFYFINLKFLLKYIYDMEESRFEESYKKLAKYFIDCSDAIFGFTKYAGEYNNQTFNIKQQKAVNILELYNIFQNVQEQQQGTDKKR